MEALFIYQGRVVARLTWPIEIKLRDVEPHIREISNRLPAGALLHLCRT